MSETTYLKSPVGCLKITGSERGVSQIKMLKREQKSSTDVPDCLKKCVVQLQEYFAGRRARFSVKLDLQGPDFYRDVWQMVRAIPYGKTRSYSDIAEILERPNASRAVGQANGSNPIPIIVPCHRVIGKNGSLTGYAYGTEVKRALLAMENPDKYATQGQLFDPHQNRAVAKEGLRKIA